MNVKELAAKSAEELRTRGWTTGRMVDDNGCVCATGAVAAAATGDPQAFESGRGNWVITDDTARELLLTLANQVIDNVYLGSTYRDSLAKRLAARDDEGILSVVTRWNDRIGKRQEDVLEAFDRIASE